MIEVFNRISELCVITGDLIEKARIKDYRLSLRVNNDIMLYLLAADPTKVRIEEYFPKLLNKKVKIEIVTNQDLESDIFFEDLFKSPKKISFESRRRLSNLLNIQDDSYKSPCPVVTFYSYKGGMGRSTAMAACASYLAMHYEKRIVIVDCDLEAPGFTNYYLEEPEVFNYRNGLVEYLLDKDFLEQKVSINKYTWEASKEYAGKGEIHIMPAGNLSDEAVPGNNNILELHRTQYLEGLSRLDLSSSQNIVVQFRNLVSDLYEEFKPDVILIDSRTGFNDIFGITALHLSTVVVGFFGINAQNIPGLHFFIDSIKTIKSNLQAILVNSILPSSKYFHSFVEQVDRYLSSITHDDEDPIEIEKYPISRNSMLENIGTSDEYKPDFINLVKNRQFSDYNELFNKINSTTNSGAYREIETLDDYEEEVSEEKDELEDLYNTNIEQLSETQSYKLQCELKHKILENLNKNWPELYAKNIDYEKEFNEKRYFFRNCMEDIFNYNKFLVIGNKGTGKTYLYQSLKNNDVARKLQERANKTQYRYEFFHLIDNKSGKYIDTNKFASENISNSELFYERFWILYIWNAIMLESEARLGYKPYTAVIPIKDDTRTKTRFMDILNDDQKFTKIEDDLYRLDSYLSGTNIQIIAIFDELDEIVKPYQWSQRITPLIQFWRKNSYAKIFPKLFIRSDLFKKLSNITNVKELINQSIFIEWTQEELFSYFFKLVFSNSKEEFFKLMKLYHDFPWKLVNKMRRQLGEDNQAPLDSSYLRPLVETFFGKYAGIDNNPRFGESYNWFFKNLKNADFTISLRPFLDLLAEAIKYSIKEDKKTKPILPQYYYVHGGTRKNAVQRHIEDLATEKGNTDLNLIFEYIRTKAHGKYKILFLRQSVLHELLAEVIEFYGEQLENKSVDALKTLLKVNGIIAEKFYSGGVEYSFAFLYKYYLGLRNTYRTTRVKYSKK